MSQTESFAGEQNLNAIFTELASVITALKSGQAVSTVLLGELLKAGTLVQEGSAVPGEVADSKAACLRTAMVGAANVVNAVLGWQ